MARVKRGKIKNKKRKVLLESTKGFQWGRKLKKSLAKTAINISGKHSLQDRRKKKSTNRSVFNVKISALLDNISYNEFINKFKKKGIILNRKVLSEIAQNNPTSFKNIIDVVNK